MRAAVSILLVIDASAVVADDDLPARLGRKYAVETDVPAPLLDIDPVLRPNVDGLLGKEIEHVTNVDLGRRVRLVLEGVERFGGDDPAVPTGSIDIAHHGWRTDGRVFIDLGFARLGAGVSLENIQTRYTQGTYYDVGISLARTFKLSRWMTGWISLDIGRRRWLGPQPPEGEEHATQIMLNIGTTFR